jgi:hypothetical protein
MAEVSNSYAVKKPYLTASFPPVTPQKSDFKSRLCDIQGNASMVAVQSNVILQNSAGRSPRSVSYPTMVRLPLGALKGSGSTRRCLKLRNAPDWRAVRPPSGRCRGPTRAGSSGNADSNSPRKLSLGKLVFAGDGGAGGDSGAFLRARRQTSQLVILHISYATRLAFVRSTPYSAPLQSPGLHRPPI